MTIFEDKGEEKTKANYHTHTARCRHAKGSDREYVENAIMGGMKVLGFADHCPFVFDDGFVSGIRMTPNEVDGYFSSLLGLKAEYKKDITIYIGFESEYIPELIRKQDELLKDYPVDYMIMGQHFLTPEYEGRYVGRFKRKGFLKEYVDSVIEGFINKDYRYLAHPDLPTATPADEDYEQEYTRLCEFLKERNIPVEYNLLGFSENRWYPTDSFFKIAAKAGNKLIIGCDAHEPWVLSDTALQQSCIKSAEKYGMEIIDFLPGLGIK